MIDDIPTLSTATTFHFDPTQVARLSIDFQHGIITLQTQAAETETEGEPIQAEQTAHKTDELEQLALNQALLVQQLPQLFATVLGIPMEQVEPTTDFFEYGGDSLAIASLLSTIEERFHLQLQPDLIFDHPALEDLAAAIAPPPEAQPTTTIQEREAVLA